MAGSSFPSCPVCGGRLVLEMDPDSPPDDGARVLLADPPFRYSCGSADCAGDGSSARP